MTDKVTELRVLELFCGVGGMHMALSESGITFDVQCAVDINTVTNAIYRHNFPKKRLLQREIQSLTVKELEDMNFNTIMMSPPCQPFTRVGLKKDLADARTDAFLALLDKIESMTTSPSFLLVENVKGFEESETRNRYVDFLKRNNFVYQEFLLTPLQFGIPNSRLRYYCIAKHSPTVGSFCFSHQPDKILCELDSHHTSYTLNAHQYCKIELMSKMIQKQASDSSTQSDSDKEFQIKRTKLSHPEESQLTQESSSAFEMLDGRLSDVELTRMIDEDDNIELLDGYLDKDSDIVKNFVLDDKVMRYYEGLDLRNTKSRNSCCFTKRYGHYYVGAGSVLETGETRDDGKPELRFFTPSEIARLMGFHKEFSFPDETSVKQRFRALGNSLNVYVVANLVRLMSAK